MDGVGDAGVSGDWRIIRARHPAVLHGVVLDAGSRGVMSVGTEMAVRASLAAEAALTQPDCPFPQQLVHARSLVERLLKTKPGTVAVTKNTSEGLNAVATGLDWRPGDSVVICSDVEHANNVYLWLHLASQGVELRDVPARNGAIDCARMAEMVDASTRLVSVAAVSFVPGFRTDLAPLSEACREHDALLLVDGVQACGILDLDVRRDGVSALATSTSKGLMALRGFGFLYVAPEWIERLRPTFVARNSVETGGRHYSEFEADQFHFHADARRFEWGSPNYLGVTAVRNSLTEILEVGTVRIEARATGLAGSLAAGLADLGLPVLSPPDGTQRTHLVTVGRHGAGDAETTGDAKLDALAGALTGGGVRFTIRRGLIRFGFHLYNDETDVARVLEIARDATQRGH